jgi:hypothetical protein
VIFTNVFQRRITVGKTFTKIGAHKRPEEKIAKQCSYMFSRGQRLSDSVPVYGVTAAEGRVYLRSPRSKLPNSDL